MKEKFESMAFTATDPETNRERTGVERLQQLLRDIGGTWSRPKPKPRVLTAEDKAIKLELENSSRAWRDFQFQIGWYALEFVEPMSRGNPPTPKYTPSSLLVMNPTPRTHWLGYSKIKASNPKFTSNIEREVGVYEKNKYQKVHEAILPEFFAATGFIIPQNFLDQCQNKPNRPHEFSRAIKLEIRKVGLKHGYFSQIVKVKRVEDARKDLGFYFKGRTIRSRAYVNLDLNWLKTNFKTREKRWYDSLFAAGVPDGQIFTVPEGASRQFKDLVYSEDAPMAKYQQGPKILVVSVAWRLLFVLLETRELKWLLHCASLIQ